MFRSHNLTVAFPFIKHLTQLYKPPKPQNGRQTKHETCVQKMKYCSASQHLSLVPTKRTVFTLHSHLLYRAACSGAMCTAAVPFTSNRMLSCGFCTSNIVHIGALCGVQLCVCCSYSSCTTVTVDVAPLYGLDMQLKPLYTCILTVFTVGCCCC